MSSVESTVEASVEDDADILSLKSNVTLPLLTDVSCSSFEVTQEATHAFHRTEQLWLS